MNTNNKDEPDFDLIRLLGRYAEAYFSKTGEKLPEALNNIETYITKQTQEAYKKVDRIEVIDESGRVLVKNNTSLDLGYQDDGETLKVFVKELKDE